MMQLIKKSLILFVVVAIGVAAWLYHYAKTPLNLSTAAQQISIKPNSALPSIANQLVEQGVINKTMPFTVLARLLRKASTLQAGDYSLNKNITPYELLLALKHGKARQASIRFIEGKTFKAMRELLLSSQAIKNTISGLSNAEVLMLITDSKKHPEGLFFPDTFYFDRGTKDVALLKLSYNMMQKKLESAWADRESSLPYKNSYEALIMASIIEKETGKASERPIISGVFINRLRMGMRLQTDPTVIYGMGDKFKGNIRRKDLRKDTIYNTYTRYGLPPTPIAMPGMASIEAALHPAKTKALYFVGKGDGSHQFSNSLVEHNRAVAKYQLKRRRQ